MTGYILILMTCPSKKEAKEIADRLLKMRLVACANIVDRVESRFRWKGRLDSAKEVVVFLKTRRGLYKKVERAISPLHSYECPEVIALPIIAGSKGYLNWIDESVVR